MELFGCVSLQVSDSAKLELLKYMPLKERIRFERINKTWARLLENIWLSQEHLQFCTGSGHPVKLQFTCLNGKYLRQRASQGPLKGYI